MVKKLLLSISMTFACIILAQNSKYENHEIAEFHLQDGSTVKGYFLGEINRSQSIGELVIKSWIGSFRYANLESGESKKIDADDVKKILFYKDNDHVRTLEKIQVTTADKKLNNSEKAKEDFAYLLYDGKLKVYGSNIFRCQDAYCLYKYTEFYLQKPGEPTLF